VPTMIGFEVNTDISFIDPDWEIFEELHDRRYSLAIGYLKSVVQGNTFDNQVMNVRISQEGFYTQSKRFPAVFYGDMGEANFEFVDEDEARALLFEAFALYRSGDARSLTCIYSEGQPVDVFFGYRINDDECYELGTKRSSLPLHLRVMIEAGETTDLLGTTQGALIYQRTLDGRHLFIRAPRSGVSVNSQLMSAPEGLPSVATRSKSKQPFPLLDGFFE
jgi:hypothetical protein